MDTEIKELAGKVENFMSEIKNESQVKWKEIEEKGAATGQTLEKLDKMVSDLDKKWSVVEKRALRNEAASAEKKGMELELKEFNNVMASRDRKPVENMDQYREIKSAVNKYIRFGKVGLSDVEHKLINGVINNDGGYFMIPEYGQEMINRVFEARQVMGNVARVTMGAAQYKEFIDFEDYNDGTFQDQLTAAPSDSNNEDFNLLTITAGTQYYPKDFHRDMLEDVSFDIQANIIPKLMAGMERKIATNIITGVGGTTSGEVRGINTYTNGTTWDKVQQITSETNDAFGWDDVLENLPSALFEDFHANAKFWMRRATFFSLLTAKDSQNKYQIGNQINFFTDAPNLNILGYPVLFDAGMPAVADGALAVGFGDLEQGYILAERLGFAVHRDESNAAKLKLTARKRVGGGLRNGQAIKLLAIQ